MEKDSTISGVAPSATEQTASPTWRQDIYVVSNPLTQSELEWLRRQSSRVAAAYRRSIPPPDATPKGASP